MSHTIELNKVSKYYTSGDNVSIGFTNVDLELDMGEFVVITGESGSGKTTLLNVISGLDSYEDGEMLVCGEDTTGYSNLDYESFRKKYIGNIFQDFNLVNSYTVYQNIELVMLLSGYKKSECVTRINELIELVGLTEFARTKASLLSGGQKQRVAIARALAKDAPIIVADEPTGNLDTESAEIVMETLARASAGRLVVIVTHNYEQAEPYATRKLVMHDGRLVDDVKLEPGKEDPVVKKETSVDANSEDESTMEEVSSEENSEDAPTSNFDAGKKSGSMLKGSELRLGSRNAFNIASKFILLFIVYLFLASAVLGQYASIKSSQHENAVLGYSTYFRNADSTRIVLTKKNGNAFKDKDFAAIKNIKNIASINKNDAASDNGGVIHIADSETNVEIDNLSKIKGKKLSYGKFPDNKNGAVLYIDPACDAYLSVLNDGKKLIGTKTYIKDYEDTNNTLSYRPVEITGIILNEDVNESSTNIVSGFATIYVSDDVNAAVNSSIMAKASAADLNCNGNEMHVEGYMAIFPSDKIVPGYAFIDETTQGYFTGGLGKNKSMSISYENKFFSGKANFTVGGVVSQANSKEILGIEPEDFGEHVSCIYISSKNYKKMFDRGYYQVSVFMEREAESDSTVQKLHEAGFKTLLVKDTLIGGNGSEDNALSLTTIIKLVAELILAFAIAYSVIKMILKSRNSYYSIIRVLGGSRRNTRAILRVELLLIMFIAYAVVVSSALIFVNDVIKVPGLKKILFYLKPTDYLILFGVMLVMTLCITGRYSRKIFSKSAMSVQRGEV